MTKHLNKRLVREIRASYLAGIRYSQILADYKQYCFDESQAVVQQGTVRKIVQFKRWKSIGIEHSFYLFEWYGGFKLFDYQVDPREYLSRGREFWAYHRGKPVRKRLVETEYHHLLRIRNYLVKHLRPGLYLDTRLDIYDQRTQEKVDME